jgi:hypothetical protein
MILISGWMILSGWLTTSKSSLIARSELPLSNCPNVQIQFLEGKWSKIGANYRRPF